MGRNRAPRALDRHRLLIAAAVALGAARPQSIFSDKHGSPEARRLLRRMWAAMTPSERRLLVTAEHK